MCNPPPQGEEEVLPEVQQFCDRLRRLGYIQRVTPGRRLQGSAFASEFQVGACVPSWAPAGILPLP